MGKKIFNEDRYVNPYTDFGFKKLFGIEMNKYLILSFINTLLHGKEKIKSLTYLNTEHLGINDCSGWSAVVQSRLTATKRKKRS